MSLPAAAAAPVSVWNETQLAILRIIHYAEDVGMAEKYPIIRRLELEEGIFIDTEAQYYNHMMLLTMGGMVTAKAYRVKSRKEISWTRVWAYDLTDKARSALWLNDKMPVKPSAVKIHRERP